MPHYWSLEEVQLEASWLTIGTFDGVHRGHQEIIKGMVAGAHAAGVPAAVLTFYPHPALVLGKRKDLYYLTTPEDQAELLGELGVDVVITHRFDYQTAETSAREFIDKVKTHLGFMQLWVGYDFALGRGREGDVPTLQHLGEEFGYTVHLTPPVENGGDVVSSSQIRNRLLAGEVEDVLRLLGRPYFLKGKVIPGDGRGRLIGIPTANLEVWPELVIPKSGVYACRVNLNRKTWGAVTNIGVRPTFSTRSDALHVETHILDFQGDIYNHTIHLEFLARLRDEQRFPGVEALVAQIQRDIARAQEIFIQGSWL